VFIFFSHALYRILHLRPSKAFLEVKSYTMFLLEEKRQKARSLFMQTNLSYKEIAEQVGITKRTICNWAKHGDWRIIRNALRDTTEVQVEYLFAELNTINKNIASRPPHERHPTLQEASIRQKLISSIKGLTYRVGVSEHIDAYIGLTNYLQKKNDLNAARFISDKADDYLKNVVFNWEPS